MIGLYFKNKVTLVTGSGNGIGRATALAFAREGSSVVVADINGGDAQRTKEEIENLGGKAISCRADVTKRTDVKRMFNLINENFGDLDILVNNVGKTIRKRFVDFTEDEWDIVIDANLKSIFYCSQEAAKFMLKKQTG